MVNFKNDIQRLQQLSSLERQTLFASLVLLPLVALSLKILGYRRTKGLMSKVVPDVGDELILEESGRVAAYGIARMVDVAARRGPYKASCLKQALVAWWLLARRRIPSDIKIGVSKTAREFDAHAWVELEGRVLIGGLGSKSRFKPIP